MEKKLRSRTIKTVIACAIMFLAVSSLVGYITWAAVTSQFNLGGQITFTATGVEATVTKVSLSGAQDSTQADKFNELKFNPNQNTGDTTTWSGLKLAFDENATDIVLTFTIKNDSKTKKLNVAIVEEGITESNVTLACEVTGEGATPDSDYKSVKIDADKTATYKITLSVSDKTQDVNITDFKLKFTMTTVAAD